MISSLKNHRSQYNLKLKDPVLSIKLVNYNDENWAEIQRRERHCISHLVPSMPREWETNSEVLNSHMFVAEIWCLPRLRDPAPFSSMQITCSFSSLYVVSYEKIFYASERFFAEEGRGGGMSELRLMLLLLVYPFKASSEQQSVNFCKTDKLTFLETIWQFLDFSKCRKRAPKNLFKAIAKAALLINFQRESLLSLLI